MLRAEKLQPQMFDSDKRQFQFEKSSSEIWCFIRASCEDEGRKTDRFLPAH